MTGREADLIAALFAPLTRGDPGAFDLRDDAAHVRAGPGGLIVTVDQVIEGTHFLPDDPPEAVAAKLVRRNLSDLVAKGARPVAAFLTIAWPVARDRADLAAFAAALGRDLDWECGGCPLLGGDTSRTDGGLVATLTLMGGPGPGREGPVPRGGGRAGDVLMVTGDIGASWLGLQARLGRLGDVACPEAVARSLTPRPPPLAMADVVARHARAAIDVSDGLLADAAALGRESGLGVAIDLDATPLHPEVAAWLAAQADRTAALLSLAGGGDDYQTLCAIDPQDARDAQSEALAAGATLTAIGRLRTGTGLDLTVAGEPVAAPETLGWQF
jgi:thiamine-monophosphate kinase